MKPEFSGECDWCRRESNELVEHQDFEEGLAGQLWDVCGDCRRKENQRIDLECGSLEDAQEAMFHNESI